MFVVINIALSKSPNRSTSNNPEPNSFVAGPPSPPKDPSNGFFDKLAVKSKHLSFHLNSYALS
jgi:hypothetical protein